VRRPRGGKLSVSTSLTERDLERLHYVAARGKVSIATWIRNVVVAALNECVDPDVELACTECGCMPSRHNPNGCTTLNCRCPKYRRPQ
jgi:hypothetical protein